jgi:curved DNA-binding protein CbpA
MKNYYEILGVEEEASGEEIRARWIELTKRYHPDLGETEEGDEKIREINEAYEILKGDLTRFQYDFERDLKRSFIKKVHRQQERRMNIQKIVILPCLGIFALVLIVGFIVLRSGHVPTPPKTEVLPKKDKVSGKMTASRTPPVKIDSTAQSEGKALKEIKEVVIPPESKKEVMPQEIKEMASLSARQSPSEVERESDQKKEPFRNTPLESRVLARLEKEAPKAISKEIPEERTGVVSAPFPLPAKKGSESNEKFSSQGVMKSEIPVTKEVSEEVPKETPRGVAKEIPKEVPRETPSQVAKEVSKEVPEEISEQTPKEILEEAPKEPPKEVAKVIPKEAPKEIPKEVPEGAPKRVVMEIPKEVPKEVPKKLPREVVQEAPRQVPKEAIEVTFHPGERLRMWTKEERTVPWSPPLLAKEEEVKQFFSDYIDRYHRRDVKGFLSLFSSKAIQNQTDGFEAIGNLYTKFINQSQELRYQIEGMKIEISQHRVDVKARFRMDQKLKKGGEEKVWKGNIRWVLVKEGGRLKIISLNY